MRRLLGRLLVDVGATLLGQGGGALGPDAAIWKNYVRLRHDHDRLERTVGDLNRRLKIVERKTGATLDRVRAEGGLT